MHRTLLSLLLLLSPALHAQYREAPSTDLDFDAAQSYCAGLSGSWRTLGIKELFGLRGDPAFSQKAAFWSSDTAYDGISLGNTGSEGDGGSMQGREIGYTLFLRDGDVTLAPLNKRIGVICTDAPVPQPAAKRYDASEAGVVDRDNLIVWLRLDAFDRKTKRSYEGAQEYCEGLDLYGRSWRLPTLEELYSIVTYERTSPSVDTEHFGVMMSRYYWSDDAFGDRDAYVVGFKLGSVATSSRENESYFRCVSDLEE